MLVSSCFTKFDMIPVTSVDVDARPQSAADHTVSPSMPPQLVALDTNVCLDLFVFADKHSQAILAALEAGSIKAVTRADCRAEWLAVLHYQHLALDDERRANVAAQFDRFIECVAPLESGTRLPVCTDKDDQKFLQLARDAQVAYLITKDKALLKLARKVAKLGLFAIVVPNAWHAPSV